MPQLAYPTQLRDHRGNEVRLPPKPFAVGGEGAVFDVLGRDDLVAKLYTRPQSKERCDKLRAMAQLCRPELLKIAAWPTATLSRGNGASIDGILMPKVAGYREIHHLYSVAQRKKEFPDAGWDFLLHTARNCAIAFEAVHAHGHVVGDVNQKNVMVSGKGVVAFVDCDSFQVAEGARVFRCGVGVPEYTPPELQGKNFASLDRSADHDQFGLAVLIFHLLMMGRHPFSGVPLTQADMPIEKAIREGSYAYTRDRAGARLKPPPNVPPVAMLGPALLDLFERAFCTPRRPTATEWQASLDAAMKQLEHCKIDRKHVYLKAAGSCPWCELVAVARLMYFLPSQVTSSTALGPEDIERLITRLFGITLVFDAYARPRPKLPVALALPAGLQAVKKPAPVPYPAAPSPIQKPVLTPLPLAPPVLPKPLPVPLPPAPKPAAKPPLEPHPPAPPALPPPRLQQLPAAPLRPEPPELGPPDNRLAIVCTIGMATGMLIVFFAQLVGTILFASFTTCLLMMIATEKKRREMAHNALSQAHQTECDRINQAYAERCRPIREANDRLMAVWRSAKAAQDEAHARACKAVDERNAPQLAAFEAAEAAMRAEDDRKRYEIAAKNRQILAEWEAENTRRQAHYQRTCMEIEAKNRNVISAWESLSAARQSEYGRACKKIDEENERAIAAWKAANGPWFEEERRWRQRLAAAEAERDRLESELRSQRSASQARFDKRKKDAEEIVSSHDNARLEYRRDLQRAETDSKKIQLEEHLEKALIRDAKIRGITGRCILALESFGIEAANDVELLKSRKVPGIGPVLSRRLFDWRGQIERTFVPQQGLPESERSRIARRYAPVFLPLGQTVQAALRDLEVITSSHRARERELVKLIEAAAQNVAVAQAHLEALNKLL